MGKLINDISINAPVEKIWGILTDLELLDQVDPTVRKATLLSENRTGLNAGRKVLLLDGKNWFDEKITVFTPNEELTYQLIACSFPIKNLKHTYSFQRAGDHTKVKQVMEYSMKYYFIGKLVDTIMLRKQFTVGIKKFLDGLKKYSENNR